MVVHLKNNKLGGKVTKLIWYIHWVPFDQEWKLGLIEEDVHPKSEGMGSWFRHGHYHAKGPMEKAIGKPRLFNKQNQWWARPNINR